jgi:hypothetical protein
MIDRNQASGLAWDRKTDTTHVERTRDRGDWDIFSPLGHPRHQRERGPLEKTIMMLKTKNHERTIHLEGK